MSPSLNELERILMETKEMRCIAFVAERRVAEGGLEEVAVELQRAVGQVDGAAVAVFDASTSDRWVERSGAIGGESSASAGATARAEAAG